MATNLKPTSTKSKSKMIVFAIEIIVILAMLAILYLVLSRKPEEQPLVTVLDEEEIKPDNKVQQEIENGTSKMLGYKNIALFGVDALSRDQITKNSTVWCGCSDRESAVQGQPKRQYHDRKYQHGQR